MIRYTEDAYKALLKRHNASRLREYPKAPNPPQKAQNSVRSVFLTLPYPPSANHYWFRNRSGGLRIGQKGLDFRSEVARRISEETSQVLVGELFIEIIGCPPDKRRRDIDNLLKATLDALQHGGLYENDNQIARIEIRRGVQVIDGCLTVKCGML